MIVHIDDGWLRAPRAETPEERSSSRTLSRENLMRDRPMLIGSVKDGRSIFKENVGSASLPVFVANMELEQMVNLAGQSMQQALWAGSTTVAMSDVRGHGFLGTPGFRFEFDVDMPSDRDHKGFAGGFVHEDKLYVNIFAAEYPGHFNERKHAARKVIESATVRVKTIKLN